MVRRLVFSVLFALSCGTSTSPRATVDPDTGAAADSGDQPQDDGGLADGGGGTDGAGSDAAYDGGVGPANLRVIAANLTSGGNQSYDPGDGIHILQGLKPDVVLLQEFNYGANGEADARKMVDTAFGPTFAFYRETGAQIPNGIVSRWPITQSGTWTDPQVQNRGFAYAKLQVPGAHPLWAVSMHLLTSSATDRGLEAAAVVAQVNTVVPKGDYLVIGGDFNTSSRGEACITTFSQIVVTPGPYPVDNLGNENTSGTRSKPHDWVLGSAELVQIQIPTTVGAASFPAGLVFDSRVYTPLTDVPPVVVGDSAATNMQHMAVVKDFKIP